jgi:hypothetical protein
LEDVSFYEGNKKAFFLIFKITKHFSGSWKMDERG